MSKTSLAREQSAKFAIAWPLKLAHKNDMRLVPVMAAAASLLIAGGGCETSYPSMTCGMWNHSTFRSFREPAPEPRLIVYQATNRADYLVTYDEFSEASGSLRRRAFYLEANQKRLQSGRRPRFARLPSPEKLHALPMSGASTAGPPGTPAGPASAAVLVEMMADDGRVFAVTTRDGRRTEVELPTYPAPAGETVRVLLTPLAVVGDAVVAATIVGIYVAAVVTVNP